MLHKAKVARAIYGSSRRRLREFLGVKARTRVWPTQGYEFARRHHQDLVECFLAGVPSSWDFKGKTVCEVGCSDCFATASLASGLGAAHVHLIEPSAPQLSPLQAKILQSIHQAGLPVDPTILQANGEGLHLDSRKVTYHHSFMEGIDLDNRVDYLFSFDVLEHVEDLDGFYRACHKALKPGGRMFHRIDFTGHSELEDPVPPLDYQTYPDWLFDLMYPPFHRTTRSFVGDHYAAMRRAGLVVDDTKVTRQAEPAYLEAILPRLRPQARARQKEELSVLIALVFAHKE